MEPQTRRDFLADVGKGMLTASIGTGLASGLGLSTALAEEFGRTRKAYRWDHVVALARVTASEYGKRAAAYEQACGLLRVGV